MQLRLRASSNVKVVIRLGMHSRLAELKSFPHTVELAAGESLHQARLAVLGEGLCNGIEVAP
ncbi:MAG: hypothetical protein OXR73_11450 [Myxococcales bacterium]|nr:hypothetical protein [Myxococcales bacterium]